MYDVRVQTLSARMAEKVVKAVASAARRGPQRIYFPNRIIQYMPNQDKTVCVA